MQNTSRTNDIWRNAMFLPLLAILLGCTTPTSTAQGACNERIDRSMPTEQPNGDTQSGFCLHGTDYHLNYSALMGSITLAVQGLKTVELETVERERNPGLVGAGSDIRFLPPRLQPYMDRSILLYLTAERSSGGDGSGQCGAGAERFLNILSMQGLEPQRIAKVLVARCREDIELAGSELAETDTLSAFSIADGRLQVDFLFYGEREGPAHLDESLSRLVFNNN